MFGTLCLNLVMGKDEMLENSRKTRKLQQK